MQDLPMKPDDESEEGQELDEEVKPDDESEEGQELDEEMKPDDVKSSGINTLLKKRKIEAASSDVKPESKSTKKPDRCGFLLGDGAVSKEYFKYHML